MVTKQKEISLEVLQLQVRLSVIVVGVGAHPIVFVLERSDVLLEATDVELSLFVILLKLFDFREQLISLPLDLGDTLAGLCLLLFESGQLFIQLVVCLSQLSALLLQLGLLCYHHINSVCKRMHLLV